MSAHQTTPLRSSYDDLPSLGFSSSPLGESPRSSHNYSSRFYRLPISTLPKPERLTDTLPSSPPGIDAYHPPSKSLPALGPSATLSDHVSPRKNYKNEASRRLSDILSGSKLNSDPPKRSNDQIDIAEEYSIMGSSYGFLVDTSGHVRLSPLKKKAKRQLSITRERLLSQDSDSENEEQADNVEYNAVGAFARVLTRSRIDSAQVPAASKLQEQPSYDRSFYDPTATPKSQGSTLVAPSTPLSTGNFQANIMTPPGSMFAFDHPMYSTGMTPYLPRS